MSLSIVVVTDLDGDVLDIMSSEEAAKKLVGQQLDHLCFIVSDFSTKDVDRHLTPLTFPVPVMDKEMLLGIFNQDASAMAAYHELI
jgi:hypothetical protein